MISVQEHNIALLSKLGNSGNLPHALLFTGQDEVNAQKTACKFAQWLFHKDTDAHSQTASNFVDFWRAECPCVSCAQVAGLLHPDFLLHSNTQLTIGEVRGIIAKFSLAPFVASRKIAVISSVQNMPVAAGNALLKTLEEPKGNALFILIANTRSNLMPTIVSRALEIRFVAPRHARQDGHVEFTGRALWERLQDARRFNLQKKPELCDILDLWLLKLREKIMTSQTHDVVFGVKQILEAKKLLVTSNVNPELLMEELHLNLQDISYA